MKRFSKRTLTRLNENGVKDVDQLKYLTDRDILRMYGLGRKGLGEIKQLFEMTGCHARKEAKTWSVYERVPLTLLRKTLS